MRRHTIAGLMVVTLVVAVAFAALRDASDTWAGILLLLTLLLLGIATLGMLHRRDDRRAFWLGFALFGWGYLALSQGPWFADQVQPRLPTTHLLSYAHAQWNPRGGASGTTFQVQLAQSNVTVNGSQAPLGAPVALDLASSPSATAPPAAVKSFFVLLGTGNLQQFQRIGQCLFALLAALAGAWISRWFHRTSRLVPPAAEPTG